MGYFRSPGAWRRVLLTTTVRVSPAELQTDWLVSIRVDEIDYHFTLGRVQTWNQDIGTRRNFGQQRRRVVDTLYTSTCRRLSGLACGEFVFCLEDATDEAIVAAKAGWPEFIYYRGGTFG